MMTTRTATQTHMDAIRARRVDGTTRQMMATGVRLTWAQADDLGEEAIQWLRRRLDLSMTTDDQGVTCEVMR